MLTVYLDESGTHRGSNICVIGGLVASPQQWTRLSVSWRKVLDSIGVEFHASDCATGRGDFEGWEKSDREKLFERLANVVSRYVAYRVWTAVVIEDYHARFHDSKERYPYSLCALGCASRLRWLAIKRGPDYSIPYCFDQGEKGRWTFSVFENLLRKGRGDVFRMATISKGDRRKLLPLQAADLHVYEVYRYFSDQLESGTHRQRPPFRELLRIPDCGGFMMNGDRLEQLTHGVVRQHRENIRNEPIAIPADRLALNRGIKLTPPNREELVFKPEMLP